MFDVLKDFYDAISIIDLIYLIITIFSLISCYKKGFVLSILSMAKWLLAYVVTLIIFPKIKPYVYANVEDSKASALIWHKKILDMVIKKNGEEAFNEMMEHLKIAELHARKILKLENTL